MAKQSTTITNLAQRTAKLPKAASVTLPSAVALSVALAAKGTSATVASTVAAAPGNVAQPHNSNPKANAYTRYTKLAPTQLVAMGPHSAGNRLNGTLAPALAAALANGPVPWSQLAATELGTGSNGRPQGLVGPHLSYLTGFGCIVLA